MVLWMSEEGQILLTGNDWIVVTQGWTVVIADLSKAMSYRIIPRTPATKLIETLISLIARSQESRLRISIKPSQ